MQKVLLNRESSCEESDLVPYFSQIESLLIVPRLFEEKWRDTVFGFPWGVVRGAWRVVRGAWFRVFSGYFVPLTPPTVSVRSF